MSTVAKPYHAERTDDLNWWQQTVIYEIYPRSFQDSDGDGVGDLQGIINRLDYLADLGVGAIWICPIYPSPMVDFGYDVANYRDIHPQFGDLETFDRLLDAAHARDIRVIIDFVPNHTSDQHPWFLESRSSRDNPKRDWYYWADPQPDGSPPNNWESQFGGPAWSWDEKTGQYYLHMFLPEQPDLNWRNPQVVEAMHDVIRFWLDRGVDGLRVDAIILLMKDADLRDNPPIAPGSFESRWGRKFESKYTMHRPETFEMVRGMRTVVDEYHGRVHIGETGAPDFQALIPYYGKPLDGYHIPYNFSLLHAAWDPVEIRHLVEEYYQALPQGTWPNFVLGNHDDHRLATRYGKENHRSAGLLLLTVWGTPTMYYGDELGMEDVFIPVEDRIDPWGINMPETDFGRDPERTPMQWNDSPNAGFTTGEPWLPLADDYEEVNVEAQLEDAQSTLNFYRQLLQLRRELPALYDGSLAFVDGLPEDVLAYVRQAGDRRLLIAINFGEKTQQIDISDLARAVTTLLSTRFISHEKAVLTLQPHEGVLLGIRSSAAGA